MPNDFAIKRIPSKSNPFSAQDAVLRIAMLACIRAHIYQTKITGAPAKVSDKHQFIMIELALIEIGSTHWLVLKHDLVESTSIKHGTETRQCKFLVSCTLGPRKSHRSPNDYLVPQLPKLGLAAIP